MKILRMDHVGVVVQDLAAAKAFFVDLGLRVQGEMDMEGEWVDAIIGLENTKSTIVMLEAPDGQTKIELAQFYRPVDEAGLQPVAANTLGIRHLAFAVDDLDAMVVRLRQKGVKLFGKVENYKGIYKLCYVHGPEGIIVELAEGLRPVG
jgi:catechol 2,3-dioxygenase-like lactoylglutathione lyase family enzyme